MSTASRHRGLRRPPSHLAALGACLAAAAIAACTAADTGDADSRAAPDSAPSTDAAAAHDTARAAADGATGELMQVRVWFARGEEVVPVARMVAVSDDTLSAALRALLAGPGEAERRQGLTSWFSAQTADALRSAHVDAGLAVVDLRDLRSVIPNASSSLGSTLLLAALDRTVFAASPADSVEYRFDGSCDAFGEFVQRGCVRYLRAH